MIIDTPWMPNVLGGGDVAGPASATDNAVARFDGTTGKLIQNSVVTIADSTGAIAGASSLTSPASTPLTLGTTDSGAAITVLSASNNVGVGIITPSNKLAVYDSTAQAQAVFSGYSVVGSRTNTDSGTIRIGTSAAFHGRMDYDAGGSTTLSIDNVYDSVSAAIQFRLRTAGTPVTALSLSGSGTVSIASTAAGSANAGALVVAGGLATGAASYFGGAVTVSSANPSLTLSGSDGKLVFTDTGVGVTSRNWAIGYSQAAEGDFLIKVSTAVGGDPISGTTALGFDRTGAATFAGAVTAASAAPEIVMIASSGNPMLRFSDTTGTVNNRNWKLTSNNSANGDFLLMRSLTTGANAGTVALGFDRDGAATFAGAVTVSGTGASSFAGPLIVGAATSAVQTAWTATTYNGHIAFPDTSQFSVYSEPNANYRGGGMLANIVRTTVGWDFANSASPGWRVGFGNGPLQDAFAISRTPATTFGEVTFLGISNTGAATFSGAVTIGNTVNTVSPTSPNRTITMVVGGVTLYIAAKTTND